MKKNIKKTQNPYLKMFVVGAMVFAIALVSQAFVQKVSSGLYDQTPLELSSLTGEYDPYNTQGTFYGQTAYSQEMPSTELAMNTNVLGDTSDNKRIEVDLTNQRLYAFEGDRKVYDFLISSGKWGRTPTGNFRIWIKLRYTRMKGGNKALGTFYDLPNVPYTMFFAGGDIAASRGFGIHGTYWHSNFGHPMSHGCINMKTEEVAQVYEWANPSGSTGTIRATQDNPGTAVIIYGKAPQS